MEMQQNDHFIVAWLEECMFDVVVENVNFVAPQRGVPKTVDMCLQSAADPLGNDIRSNVQILQFRVAFAILGQNEFVLLHGALLFAFLGLLGAESFLHFFDETGGGLQIHWRRINFTRLSDIAAFEGPKK